MKKKIKYLVIILSIFLLTGCLSSMSPSEKVEDMLNEYIKNDERIMKELDEYISKQELSYEQQDRYKDIIKNEYATIKYNVVKEDVKEYTATVEVNLTVKDLYGASKQAEDYLTEHPTEFYTDGIYDADKFIDYKLSIMEETTKTVEYTIYINLSKNDDVWDIEDLSDETLEKIHGIYNYEN